KPWSSRVWMGLMPSTRWGNGWKSGGCWRCCSRDSHAPPAMMTAWVTSSRRCVRPISTRCLAPLLSLHWRSRRLPATPWWHQDTTTMAQYGAYADEPQPPGAPRPAYGHSKDGRDDRKQVLLSLGVSGDGGVPVRLGMRDGNRSDRVETPVAIAECLALGCEGVRGIVADRKA